MKLRAVFMTNGQSYGNRRLVSLKLGSAGRNIIFRYRSG